MAMNVAQKLIASHLVHGDMVPGAEIALRIDQTLTQDATGTLVMLEFEAMGIPRVRTELSAQYVDHNLLQTDFRNADDHLFLLSACRKFGIWFSRPGNGVSHPLHMERFGRPGASLLGSDSHTCAAGALGMLAIGAGGLEVAAAMAGEPFYLTMPKIMGVRLSGRLPDWVSAKDIILEMLRRHGVEGGLNRIIEYTGPGLDRLGAMDRHVIANMGAELGATTSVFPSDDEVRLFLGSQQREAHWQPIAADADADYDERDAIDLSELEPLIACPSSPGNVVPVSEVAGRPIYQAYIGSSANPGLRDFAVPALMLEGRRVHPDVSFDVNPTSREQLETLLGLGLLHKLLHSGARLHQTGCNGCIGMGQAPATGRISLRTVPRNFPGRSGTREDQVFLCSPETATASALTGVITDPRTLSMGYPRFVAPDNPVVNTGMLLPPEPEGATAPIEKGPNIRPLPELEPLPALLSGPVLLKLGDDISTDEIMPAGARVLPYRSNIQAIARFVFEPLDETFYERALASRGTDAFVVAGDNYGQGSSREHAALAPRFLGVRVVLARSFARIHWQNLVNFGIVPLTFADQRGYDQLEQDDALVIEQLAQQLRAGPALKITNTSRGTTIDCRHQLSGRQCDLLIAGSLIGYLKARAA
ncbi:MAG: aconitate hydratase [Gammaproteobacteria bacterium]